jgi:hypothetical protein
MLKRTCHILLVFVLMVLLTGGRGAALAHSEGAPEKQQAPIPEFTPLGSVPL